MNISKLLEKLGLKDIDPLDGLPTKETRLNFKGIQKGDDSE